MSQSFIPVSRPFIGEPERRYVADAVASGWVSSLGRYIDEFEHAFAAYCGTRHAVATSNGTTALHLALAALDIKAGDEVIVPDLTFVATANAVAYTGATPVLVDVDALTCGIDADVFARAIGPRTKAVIPVHLYGHPVDMDPINALAERHGIAVIEDAAEAHGARYRGRRVGSLGRAGVFSFYGNKIVTTGEGGIITTDDEALVARIRRLRDHAMSPERRYWHAEVGFNYRMTNLQAALGKGQMEQIDHFTQARQAILDRYRGVIACGPRISLNRRADWAEPVVWMICLEVDWFDAELRERFMAGLKRHGIDSRPYFHPLSTMPMYAGPGGPVARRKSVVGVNLPIFVGLTDPEIDFIGATVNGLLAELEPVAARGSR